MRLLAQRGHFQPCAGGQHQHFKRGAIEHAFGAAIGIEQGRDFIFENQGEHDDLFVLGSAKLLYEAPIHFGDVGRSDDAVLIGVGRGSGGHVERKSFMASSSPRPRLLPSGRRSAFYDEERDARAVGAACFEQRAQNFFLRASGMNAGHGLHQIAGADHCRAGPGFPRRFRRLCDAAGNSARTRSTNSACNLGSCRSKTCATARSTICWRSLLSAMLREPFPIPESLPATSRTSKNILP
jgi:hypothetical protein